MTEEDFDLTMAVHIKGAFNVVKQAWRLMREQEYGRIVLTSSGASFGAKNYWCAPCLRLAPAPLPSLSRPLSSPVGRRLYGTAKSAMIGMANNLRHEGRDLNIKVNALMPGAATAMTASDPTATEEAKAKMAERMPPELVTCAAVWLCHEDNVDSGECIVAESGSYGRVELLQSELLQPHWSEGPKSVEWVRGALLSRARLLRSRVRGPLPQVRDNFDTILALSEDGQNDSTDWRFLDAFGRHNSGVPFGRKERRPRL